MDNLTLSVCPAYCSQYSDLLKFLNGSKEVNAAASPSPRGPTNEESETENK